jgi:predicted NAD/FAD-binding protein
MRRVAVVGSGISGLAAAWHLAPEARVTLYEAGGWFGGHTNTVDVSLDGVTHGVDTGFLVLNQRTYPRLLELLAALDVPLAPAEMSFSVQVPDLPLEWSGSHLGTVFAQRRNLLRPRFWRLLGQILRFNRLATALALRGDDDALREPVDDFLRRHRFGDEFRDWYFLPMIGCIWSCPTDQMLRFPVATLIRFCHNHGLLQVDGRPPWYTVRGGARQYVRRMLQRIADARLATPVRAVRRLPPGSGDGGVIVATDHGSERYDEVVLACHSDQSLALLADASAAERRVLGAIGYQPNRALLHTDTTLLPRRQRAWAAWNYERSSDGDREAARVCLHYLLNRLQPLPFTTPVIVSLNPARAPAPGTVLAEFDYAHPVFDQAAIDAQRQLGQIQGRAHTWYCGAWTGYGFHEDGLRSALAVVDALRAAWAGAPPRLAQAA